MISARPKFDVDLVRGVIEERGLDPVPTGDPRAFTSADGARLTIEEYSWGRVFFAEFRARALGVTWVELEGATRPELPSWASVLRDRVDPPSCFGWWRPVRECDGKGTPGSPPCFWRGRCVALQRRALRRAHTSDLDLDPATYPARLGRVLEGLSWADLDADLERRPPPALPQRKLASQSWTPEQEAAEAACYALGRFLVTRVAEIGGWPMVDTRFRCSVGRCFMRESWTGRDNPRRLLSLYLRVPPDADNATPRTLAVFRVLVGQRYGVQARIWTASPDPVAAHLPEGIEVRPVRKDHARLSVSVSVSVSDHETAEALARAIVFVVNSGLLTSRGSIERSIPTGMAKGVNVWSRGVRRRGRR